MQSWVRADLAHLDALLARAVRAWLEEAWPWPAERIRDHPRAPLPSGDPSKQHDPAAPMEQRLSLVTLGVADLARARAFYERLGWRGQQVEETVCFRAGTIGVVLWGRDALAADSGIPDPGTDGFGGIALAHNVRSPGEVDAIVAAAADAGATITRAPGETFYGGYAGCFLDPDGHVWEIAHNPGFPLDDDGALTIPDLDTPIA